MVLLLLILLVLFAIFILLMLAVFWYVFVRRNNGNLEDINDPKNEIFGDWRPQVEKEMNFIRSTPHRWVETVSFDGVLLKARYFDRYCKKTVVMFHGYRSSAVRDFAGAIRFCFNEGFNVLLVDQRAHGKSGGRVITFGVKESRDALTWIDFVCEKYAPEKIVLGGMSMGATTVLLASGHPLPDSVKAVIADCGFTTPREIMECVAKSRYNVNIAPLIPVINLCCRAIGRFSITNDSTLTALEKCKTPVLLIHGEADGLVPCEMSRRGFEKCNEHCKLLTIPEAGHGFSSIVDRERVLTEVKNFFAKSDC